VTRFNLAAAPEARERLAAALRSADPASALGELLRALPIPQRLREVGFDRARIPDVADEVARLAIKEPRPVTQADAAALLAAAF
jgi:maleylacetate reductase